MTRETLQPPLDQSITAAPSLRLAKSRACTAIDRAAEAARTAYQTPGAGQALVYRAKEREAARVLAAPDHDHEHGTGAALPADLTLLPWEVGVTAPNLRGVAAIVHANAEAWRAAIGPIENIRLTAKNQIANSATVNAVVATATIARTAFGALAALSAPDARHTDAVGVARDPAQARAIAVAATAALYALRSG